MMAQKTNIFSVAKHELQSSKLTIYRQQPNSNIFFVSTREEEVKRVTKKLKVLLEQFKIDRVGTSFEAEQLKL